MARLSRSARHEALIAATVAVMRERGIAGTTVREVAQRVGTSSGLIHHYVDSMDDLLAEAFERVAGEDFHATRRAVLAVSDPVQQLRAFLDSYARTDGLESMQVWLDAWAEARRHPTLQRASRSLNQDWHRLLAGVLRSGKQAGAFRVTDVKAAAWRILSLLDGLLLQSVAHEDVVTPAQARRWSRTGVARELGIDGSSLQRISGRAARRVT